MGIFGKKLSPKELASQMSHNVFKEILLKDESFQYCIQGTCESTKLFSVGVMAATDNRLLYYFQDGNISKTETILYDKIVSICRVDAFEKKRGNFIAVEVELANGNKRVVRCNKNDTQSTMVNELIFFVESKR